MDGDAGSDAPVDTGGDGREPADGRGAAAERSGADGETATARVAVENVGGIDETTVTVSPGVTVLVGRNATNRTSLLRAIGAALGADARPLRRGADDGRVDLTLDGETHTRSFERTDDGVVAAGDPYLADPTAAETYALLLEDNDVRRAVRTGGDLAGVVMRPVDTDAIEAEVERLSAEKRRVDDRLDDFAALDGERADLAAERRRLEADIETFEGELADLESAIEAADASLDDGIERDERLEARLDDLRAARTDLESVIDDLAAERDTLAAVERERDGIEADLVDTSPVDDDELAALADDIAALRERKRRLDSDVSALQGIVRFNENQLESGSVDDIDGLSSDAGSGSGDDTDPGPNDDDHVTERLTGSEAVTCWTCGSTVDRATIEGTLGQLRDLRERRLTERRALTARIDRLAARRERLEQRRRERAELLEEREQVESELDRRTERIGDLERRRRELNDRVRDLEAAVEQLRSEDYADLLDLHRRANERQVELEQRRSDLATVESELSALDERLEERDRLERRREQLRSDLRECRTRLDRTAAEAVATFNDHADALSVTMADFEAALERVAPAESLE